jgi:chromosomal replication initiation ATPase DnaA
MNETKTSIYAMPGIDFPAVTAARIKEDREAEQARSDAAQQLIINTVCQAYKISFVTLTTKCRKREIVESRQVLQCLLKIGTKLTLAGVGWMIGEKDHATVMHSIRTVKNLFQTNRPYRERLTNIMKMAGIEDKIEYLSTA